MATESQQSVPACVQFCSSRASFLQLLQTDTPRPPVQRAAPKNPPLMEPRPPPPPKPPVVSARPVVPTDPGLNYNIMPSLLRARVLQPQPEDMLTIDVIAMGFAPLKFWVGQKRVWLFRDLLTGYFRSRTSRWCKFAFKLWNGLRITQFFPSMFKAVGVRWVSPIVIMVDKVIFARFLEVKKATTAIFSVQGVLPTHGFVEIPAESVLRGCPTIADYDQETCKFFTRPDGKFSIYSVEADIAACNYIAPNRE